MVVGERGGGMEARTNQQVLLLWAKVGIIIALRLKIALLCQRFWCYLSPDELTKQERP